MFCTFTSSVDVLLASLAPDRTRLKYVYVLPIKVLIACSSVK